MRDATIAGLESIKEGKFSDKRRLSRSLVKFVLESPSLLGYAIPPGAILKLPSYLAPLISAMRDVGGFVRRGVCL